MTTLRTIFCTLVVLIATINVSAWAAGTDEALARYVPTDAVLVLEVRDPDRLERTFKQMAKEMGKESFDRTLSGEASHGIFGGENNPADPDKGMMIAVSFRQKENAGWGGMPESEVTMIFHAAKDHTKAPEPRDKDYKTIRIIDGVVIATHATDWSAPTERCPLVAMLMPGEISGAFAFDTIWKRLGPMTEMSIGMMVAMAGQKQDKPPSSTALAPLWAALQDVGTIQVGLSFGSDAVSLNSRINTVSPVTDRPDGPAIRAMATHLDNTPIMFALDEQLANWFHTVMTDFLQIATMFAAQESNAPAGLDKVSDQIHLIMEATLKADRAGMVSTYDIFNQRSVTIQGTNDPAKTIALHRNMLKELAKVPEFMTLSPVQGTPNAWTIKIGPLGRKLLGSDHPHETAMRLVEIDSDTIAGITGPLDWNPLGTDRSNELTAIYDRTTSAPPAMVITLDLGQVINLFMIKLSDMGGKTAMSPDASRLTMTMTPHEGHWDLNADLVGTMTLMKSIGAYESEKKKEKLDRMERKLKESESNKN